MIVLSSTFLFLSLMAGMYLRANVGVILVRIFLLSGYVYTSIQVLAGKNWARWIHIVFYSIGTVWCLLLIAVFSRVGLGTECVVALMYGALNGSGLYVLLSERKEFTRVDLSRKALRYSVLALAVAGSLLYGSGAAHADPPAVVAADPSEISAGTILQGEPVHRLVRLENHSNFPVKITARPGCGCTVLSAPPYLPADGSGVMDVYVHTFDEVGSEQKMISVYWREVAGGGKEGTITVRVRFEVKELFDVIHSDRIITLADTSPVFSWKWKEKLQDIDRLAPEHVMVFRLQKLASGDDTFYNLRPQPYESLDGHGGQTFYARLLTKDSRIIEVPFHISTDYRPADETAEQNDDDEDDDQMYEEMLKEERGEGL